MYEPIVPSVPNAGLGERTTASAKLTPVPGISSVEDAAVGEHERARVGISSFAATASASNRARAFRRLDRRVAHHQRHAARVRAEIDRRQVRVAGDGADVERIDARAPPRRIAASTSSEPWPISVAPQNAVTPPLRSTLSCTPECGMSFQ